jgi:tetratricopeptide (TPR) repeat protein/transglutaminase-like putative cysteine protease
MTTLHSRFFFLSLLVTLFLGLNCPLVAAEWPVPRGPSHEPVPYQYDPAQWKEVPRECLEDWSTCVLYSCSHYLVDEDGTTETISHEVTRFNGRKGIDKYGEYRGIVYDPTYQKLTLNEARIHKVNGEHVDIDPRHVQLRDVSTDFQVYEHDKQLVISFPNLEIGDVAEVKWTVIGRNPEHHGHFFTRYTFGDDQAPVVLDEIRVRLPKSRELKYATIGGQLEPEIKEEGDWRTYHWRAPPRRPLPLDESLPSKEDLRLQVSLTTFASWEEVGKWKSQLRSDCWECTPEIRSAVAEITHGLHKPLDKARALTYWVRRKIRYVSVGEKHDYTPHPPGVVLGNRYGDCKDQSQLLAVMLKEAGIPVALATLGTLDDGQVLEETPSPWGTHAILMVTIDGKQHWIDTTLSLAAWDFLPRDDRDRLCYVVDDRGIRLVRTPPLSPQNNVTEQVTHVTVDAGGSSRCERTSVCTGSAALIQRDNWLEAPPGERRRLAANELQDANSRARLLRLTVDEEKLRDFDAPVASTLVFELPDHFTGEGEREGSVADSKVWNKLLSYNLDYDRTAPLDLWMPFESRHRYIIHLPPGYRFDTAPNDQTLASRWGTFTLAIDTDSAEQGVLELEFHTVLDRIRVDPEDFEAFRKFHEEVAKHYRVWLTIKPSTDLEDAPLLETILALAPDDTATATSLARIYLDNQKPAEAQRVLRLARHYRPEDTDLWELTVRATDKDSKEEEAVYQEMVRRFPAEPKYAVRLGAVLVDRGEQAEARKVLEVAATKGSDAVRGQAHYQLARSAMLQNDSKLALKHLDQAEREDPASVLTASACVLKGQALEKQGKAEDAERLYRHALLVEPESIDALAALVRLALDADKRSEALDYLRRYTLAVSDRPTGLSLAAKWYRQLRRLDEASELAERAKDHKLLGLIGLDRGVYVEAVEHLTAVSDAADDGEVLAGLIQGYLALGRLTDAERPADQLAKLSDVETEWLQARAVVTTLLKRRQQLIVAQPIPKGKEKDWTTALDHLLCAEWALDRGQPAAAVEQLLVGAFTEEVELGPAQALRGWLAIEKGRLQKAAEAAERAVALTPNEARGYLVRGRVRLERGATAEALADLLHAADLSGRKDATVLHWLAAALAQAGRTKDALDAQREAVKLRPKDAELLEQLRDLEKAGSPRKSDS